MLFAMGSVRMHPTTHMTIHSIRFAVHDNDGFHLFCLTSLLKQAKCTSESLTTLL